MGTHLTLQEKCRPFNQSARRKAARGGQTGIQRSRDIGSKKRPNAHSHQTMAQIAFGLHLDRRTP
jgi:hypothetical protein